MASRIQEIETFVVAMPKRREWAQHGIAKVLEHRLLLRLRSDDGLEGWGEATALAQWGGMEGRYYGETVSTADHVIHDILAPAVLGAEPDNPRQVTRALDALIVGHPYAKATIEMALQDVRGQRAGQPLYQLLGGSCRSSIRIGHMLGLMSTLDATAEAAQAVEMDGVTAFQIKGGGDIERDVDLISSLRRELPSSTFLRLDGNKGYGRAPKEVAEAGRRLEAAGIDAIEQPAATVAALRACREAVRVPVIADEGCWTAADAVALWREAAVDAVSVYVAKAGGMGPAADLARTAALLGMPSDVNGSLETGIGNAASLHVAIASELLTLPSIIPVPSNADRHLTVFAGRYWEDDVVDSGFTYKDGQLAISDRPGLGIRVSEAKIRRYLVGTSRRSAA